MRRGSSRLFLTYGILVAMITYAKPVQSETEWVIVMDDPRPLRLQGWQHGDYSGSGHYSQALELKRAGRQVASKHGLLIRTEWFIESLDVYCLIALFEDDEQTTLDRLRGDESIKWVQPSNSFELLQTTSPAHEEAPILISPPELLLPDSINGKGVVVALVDSAVDDTHPVLLERVSENVDFVDVNNRTVSGEPHGTGLASVIVANRQSDLGVSGVAPQATLRAYRGCWETTVTGEGYGTNCTTTSLARSLNAVAMDKPDILNLSLSGPQDKLLNHLIDKIVSQGKGTIVVTAFDPKRPIDDRFPSASPGVLTVRSDSTKDENPPQIFSAPGSKIVAAPGDRADLMSGHSIATAYTSGILALCVQIENILKKEICSPRKLELLENHSNNNLHELVSILERELETL